MLKFLRLTLHVALLSLALASMASLHAAELGAILTRSFLEQPLNISMQLKLTAGERIDEMQCQIGMPDDFSSMGFSKPSFADDIQCRLLPIKTPVGRVQSNKKSLQMAQLQLQSSLPIHDAVFHLVLVLSSAQQTRQLQDLLLVLEAQPTNQLSTTAPNDSSEQSATAQPVAGENYTVGADETLMNVARQMGVSELEMNQFMLAVLQRNPQAFIHRNIHMMKQGSVLQLPSAEEWQSIDRQQAAQQVQQQGAIWREYRQQGATSETDNNPQVPDNALQPADESVNSTAAARDIVRLSNAAGANTRVAGLTVQEEINALRDEIAAHEVSIREANQKTAELEKQIEEMQKLLLMRDKALQQQALQQPWWSKLTNWLALHPWAFIALLLSLMLGLLLSIHVISQRRAQQAMQAMLADIRAGRAPDDSSVDGGDHAARKQTQNSVSPGQTAQQPSSEAVLEKTAQILQGISLDLSDPAPSRHSASKLVGQNTQSIDTQFDLVASYLDMGDQIGASKILQEILQNGDEAQQARARQLLGQLK